MKKIIIAVDGPAGSGKSTTAREVARELGYVYIDTGAMYRAAALAFKRMNFNFTDEDFSKLMTSIEIKLRQGDKEQKTLLNDTDVSDEIRTLEITKLVSPVSANHIVRKKLVDMQRQLGKNGGIVMDGRDIGTVVFPDAELKIFMVASPEARAARRTKEMLEKGIQVNEEQIKNDLIARDKYDSTREISPLKKAADAIEIDTSQLTIEEQTAKVVDLANEIIQDRKQ
jgi:cytidylate kinase